MPLTRSTRRKLILNPSKFLTVPKKKVENELKIDLEKNEILSEHSATPTMDSHISENTPPAHSLSPIIQAEMNNVTNHEELLVEEQEQVAEEQVTEEQEQVAEEQVTEEQEQVAEEQEPLAEEQEPLAEEQEPLAEEQEPLAEEQEPLAEEQEPLAEEQEPLAEEQEQVVEADRQISENPVIETVPITHVETHVSSKAKKICQASQADARRRAQAKINRQKRN